MHRVLLTSSLIYITHIIIKGIAILVVRQPDVRDDVVAEIFSQPRLGSPAYVA